MDSLYIQTENGALVGHPAYAENIRKAFGSIPANWELFVRVECPICTVYQLLTSYNPVYTKVAGVWTDVWSLREMTVAEKADKQRDVKDKFASRDQVSNFSAWVFDEATCQFNAPTPRPDGDRHRWSGVDNKWKEAPLPLNEGGPYKFDYTQWVWVAI